jgi:Rrf2 family protein
VTGWSVTGRSEAAVQLGEGVEWSLHCCALLAGLPPGATLPAARLAEFHGVPGAYLAKHLQALSQAGILEAVAGRRGGYRLGRPAAEVTLLDVVEAVEGSDGSFRCTEIRRRGPTASAASNYPLPCRITIAMTRADEAWRAALRSQTLADLAAEVTDVLTPVLVRKGTAWLAEAVR